MGISRVKEENGYISILHSPHSDGVQHIALNATHITAGLHRPQDREERARIDPLAYSRYHYRSHF
jgi:hypothetical protein